MTDFSAIGPAPVPIKRGRKAFHRSPLVNRLGPDKPAPSRQQSAPQTTPSPTPSQTCSNVGSDVRVGVRDAILTNAYHLCQTQQVNFDKPVPIRDLRKQIQKGLKLKRDEIVVLDDLLRKHAPGSSTLSFSALERALQRDIKSAGAANTEELERFMGAGIMDPRVQNAVVRAALVDKTAAPGLGTKRKAVTGDGPRYTQPPFAVEGDSEKMGSIIQTFYNMRLTQLRERMLRDATPDGRLSHQLFFEAIQRHDQYSPESEIEQLVLSLDPRKRGWVLVDDFMVRFGKDFLKKRSQRNTVDSQDPIAWNTVDYDKRGVMEELRYKKKIPKKIPGPKQTAASRLRQVVGRTQRTTEKSQRLGEPGAFGFLKTNFMQLNRRKKRSNKVGDAEFLSADQFTSAAPP